MIPYRKVFETLSEHGIKYLIAGGFAVNFHQVQRATVDLDLIVLLEKDNVLKFVAMMKTLGFEPRVPVKAEELADPAKRKQWADEKGMMVLSFVNPQNPIEIVDVFVNEPKPFPELWGRKTEISAFGVRLPVLSKKDLIEMKRNTGRDKDDYDIRQLERED